MSADDRDLPLEELLRSSLQSEADMITPSGDGLSRIQQRAGARRSRGLWWRPIAALGAVALIGGAGFAAYALSQRPGEPNAIVVGDTTPTPTPSDTAIPTPTPTPTVPVSVPVYPSAAFYPFTSGAAEQSWEAQGGPTKQPWVVDPKLEATYFVANFVGQSSIDTVLGSTVKGSAADVTLGRTMHDGNGSHVQKVTTVHLAKYGKAWVVLGASDAGGMLSISSPVQGATLTSPATVSGPGFGADEGVQVDVRSLSGDAVSGDHPHTDFGAGTPKWSVQVPFSTPTDARGAVIALELSAAGDGGPSRLAVTGVHFASSTQAAGFPAYFYGVKNGRVTKFRSSDGASVTYLTTAQPGGGASDPQLVGSRVYYLQGGGTCTNTLMSVPVSGAVAATTVATPQPGYVITGYGIRLQDSTFFEQSCSSGTAPAARLVYNTRVSDGHIATTWTDFPSMPPQVVGDPQWEPDGLHVDAVLRTGNDSHVATYDPSNPNASPGDRCADAALSSMRGQATALDIDASNAVWFAGQDGKEIKVVRCAGSQATDQFTVPPNATPADIAVSSDGNAVLVTDISGHLWRWSRGGSVTQLHPSVVQPQISW